MADGAAGFESAAASGPWVRDAPAAATKTTSAVAAATALPKRSTRSFVEEVEVLGVDRDRHLVAQLELNMRRERRDEVRPCADDGLLAPALERLLLLGHLALQRASVDLEVGHRLAAEGLDEL